MQYKMIKIIKDVIPGDYPETISLFKTIQKKNKKLIKCQQQI